VLRHALTGLSILSAILFAVACGLMVRSLLANDTLFYAGQGRLLLLDSVRGELSIWTGGAYPSASGWRFESFPASEGISARQAADRQGVVSSGFMLGFGYVQLRRFPNGMRPWGGSVTGIVVPYWFAMVASALLPVQAVTARLRQETPRQLIGRCRHCGSDRYAGDENCPVCRQPLDGLIETPE
jgi:hypothetical protein